MVRSRKTPRDLLASWLGRGFAPTQPIDTFDLAADEASSPGHGPTGLLDLAAWEGALPHEPSPFRHILADHPLLHPDRIREALARVPDDCVDVRAVDEEGPDGGSYGRKKRLAMSATDAFAKMERKRLWMNVQKLHRFDDGFKSLVHDVLRSVAKSFPELVPEVYAAGAYLIVSSGRAGCHFHADPDLNFLMQIRGRKRVYMWSPKALDEPTKEALAATGDHGAVPYKPEYEGVALPPVDLEPGHGAFIPLFAPHRVENDDEPCVSLSVGFVPRQAMIRLRVHEVNHELRKLGWPVTASGRVPALDGVLHGLHLGMRLARRMRARVPIFGGAS